MNIFKDINVIVGAVYLKNKNVLEKDFLENVDSNFLNCFSQDQYWCPKRGAKENKEMQLMYIGYAVYVFKKIQELQCHYLKDYYASILR